MKKYLLVLISLLIFLNISVSQKNTASILPGAYRTDEYLPLLKGKRIAIFANQTSVVAHVHLVDTLKRLGVHIVKIFSPEHGFRGNADAGEDVESYTDRATGIKIISLYGNKTKPSGIDLADVDVMLFDIQDVGVRFYTYISSLEKYIESAIQNNKPVIILDRPNPNGFYIDGPVLDTLYKSFVGMQPVPVVYGMTIGEYARMLLGEQWISWRYIRKQDSSISPGEMPGFEETRKNFKLTVIKCKNYTHTCKYKLPVKPSPNLPDMSAVYWYPSACFFEGTVISEGRGTEHPFEIFGHPKLPDTLFAFTPHSTDGAKEPKYKDKLCYGWNVYDGDDKTTLQKLNSHIQLKWLLQAYQLFPEKENFFLRPQKFSPSPEDYFFNKLAGSNELMEQIISGKTEAEIRESWKQKLDAFKKIRKKYLLYPDFY